MIKPLTQRHLRAHDFDGTRVVGGVNITNQVCILSTPVRMRLQPFVDDTVVEWLGSTHGCVISSGTTAASNSSPVKNPRLNAASRSVERSLCAFFATWAALS